MTEDDARRILRVNNKILSKREDAIGEVLWKYGEDNFDNLVKDLVNGYNQRWTEIIDNDWNSMDDD